ncbi:unnamed protein product [Rangifer tarandus platyrhynchus]|uniref:Uncharacterized protein n=2 Tax=Rangifer tarandus platyrhynchus TaxID=3082113 RepID=A0AC59Y039_RANTA|nr:unnamed protein product [Rangifer tarandus platyrhynchus]
MPSEAVSVDASPRTDDLLLCSTPPGFLDSESLRWSLPASGLFIDCRLSFPPVLERGVGGEKLAPSVSQLFGGNWHTPTPPLPQPSCLNSPLRASTDWAPGGPHGGRPGLSHSRCVQSPRASWDVPPPTV